MSPEIISATAKTPFEIGAIQADQESQAKRGWDVIINGEIVPNVTSAVLHQRQMDVKVQYGQHPSGYDSIEIHEPGGGGSVTVPYAIVEGHLLIGVVAQNRPAAGGVVMELPRGFLDPGENHDETALRETHEETGLDAVKSRLIKLGNERNPNSTFFNTSKEGEGVSFYAIQVEPDELVKIDNTDGTSYYAFTSAIQAEAQGDKTGERILGSKFIPVSEAVDSSDILTEAGVGLLTARMIGARTLRFAGVEAPTTNN